jgi:hypothetical protein
MILTVTEMYKAFLSGIKKEQTTIVPPSTFNLLINEEQDKWFKEKAIAIEIDQKRIDDLQVLRTVTDGVYEYLWYGELDPTVLNPIAPDTSNGKVFTLPIDPDASINNINITSGVTSSQKYPRYRRLLNVMFKINYVNNTCSYTGVSDWLNSNILRSDKRQSILKSPYRQPSDEKLYYEIIGNKIRLINETDSTGYAMRLEYMRYPRAISFSTVLLNLVDCELLPEQQQEIVDRAVVTYIERTKNPRYQTINIEEQKNQIYK